MRADIVPGAAFPDYELSDHRVMHRTLSELQGGDPMVVVLSRGGSARRTGDNTIPVRKTHTQVLAASD